MTNQKFFGAALLGAALLLGSCTKETNVAVQPAMNDYKQRTALEVIEAASPEYFRELQDAANNNRGPIVKTVPGVFVPGQGFPTITYNNRCVGTQGVCGVIIIGDRSGDNSLNVIPSDLISVAADVSASTGEDALILNEPSPVIRLIRGFRDISSDAGGFTFTFDEL
ncbi:MAG: hypothetical protein IM638_08330 [Bacteroidetes bacterium]|nr:hypothetical protein [Bacteroidota bacterium]